MKALSCTCTAIAIMVFATASCLADSRTAPSPLLIEYLRNQRAGEARWRVTTTDGAFDWKVADVGEAGLRQLAAQPLATSTPDLVRWSEIQRIDVRTSARHSGQVLGFLAGSVAAGFAGSTIEANATGSNLGPATWVGAGVGAVAGLWVGGRLGDRIEGRRTIYVAPDARTDGAQAVIDAPHDTVRAAVDIGRRDLLRVTGRFGQFVGRVSHVDDSGLSGIALWRTRAATPRPDEPVAWQQIARVERRRNHAATGAVIGALCLGLVVGALATELSDSFGNDRPDVALGAGFAAGAIPGALIGGIAGSAVPRWQRIYDRPLLSTPQEGTDSR